MNVAHLRRWDLTAIEIALDLEVPAFSDSSSLRFSGPAEPRICLVAAFALTPQLKHIAAAVDRALPSRLPPAIRIAPSQKRRPARLTGGSISIRPMAALLRIQSRLIRAIAPGLAGSASSAGDAVSHYIHEFIPSNALPVLEPEPVHVEFAPTDFGTLGITLYRLDREGKPQSIIGHWSYARSAGRSLHLTSGP